MVKVDKRNISLVVLLVVLVLIAVGLAVAIVFLNKPNDMAPATNETTSTEKIENAEINEKLNEIIVSYQEKIDSASTPEELVELYNSRIDDVILLSDQPECHERILKDAIAIDKILQSISSAAQVYTYAANYGYSEVAAEYQQILQERSEGVNADLETKG